MIENPNISDQRTRWIFLSPHLDDAVYSCGGLISYLSEKGIDVEIWTVFSEQADDERVIPPYALTLHTRWQAGDHPYIARKAEDTLACRLVGARQVHFGYLDCIYRRINGTDEVVIASDEELFGSIKPGELTLVDLIAENLISRLGEPSIWVCPLGMGGHVDHRIVRLAAQKARKLLLFYTDLPYGFSVPPQAISGMIRLSFDIPEINLTVWKEAVLQYTSQISSFWKDEGEIVLQYSEYIKQYNGLPLWLPIPE